MATDDSLSSDEDVDFDGMGSDEEEDDDEPVTMKIIQKLTGKLAQKIRAYNSNEEEEMGGDDVKYVINSVLSSLDLTTLNDDDVEEIIDRLEGVGEDGVDNPEMSDEEGMGDEEFDMGDQELPPPSEGGEMKEIMSLEDALNEKIPSAFTRNMRQELTMGDSMFDLNDYEEEDEYPRHGSKMKHKSYPTLSHGTFGESKIDRIISKYFNTDVKEKTIQEENQRKLKKEMSDFNKSEIVRLSESIRQERSSLKFMENNPKSSLVGVTNKGNLIFNNGNGIPDTKITRNGSIS